MDIKQKLASLIAVALDSKNQIEIENSLETPVDTSKGDVAFPCFKLAKQFRKAPHLIAQELAEKIQGDESIEKLEANAGYVNFFINRAKLAEDTLTEILTNKTEFGKSNIGEGLTIVIDYSSPNIAKPFHIGHLRSTVIGNALYNIFGELGYSCLGINHLGDWGTQFGKLIVAYKKWGDKETVEQKGIEELNRLYVRFHKEAKENSNLEDEARNWLLNMEKGNAEALELWQWFNEISLDEFKRIYKMLDIEFDYYTGESFYNDKMQPVVEEIKKKNLLTESDGAMIVKLEDYSMPPCLILRRDGGTLYPTRDIAAALYRKEQYNFHKCLYITGMDQNLHFNQWFQVVKLMGYEWADNLVHIPFGLVSFAEGKLSTREGNVILMEDLLNEAVSKTLEIIKSKNPNLETRETVAKQVGIGAVIFNDLYNSRIKEVVFSWDRMLNFEGETGPYVQYSHARACSVIEKAGVEIHTKVNYSHLTDESSIELIKLLYDYPNKLIEAAKKYEPYIVTRHMVHLAQAFNKFYHTNEILVENLELKQARLLLVECFRIVVSQGLKLVGIYAPNKM